MLLLILPLVVLSGCTNTLEGIKKDSNRAGEKVQAVTQVITEP